MSIRYVLLSVIGFSLMACCVKLAYNQGIPVLEIIFARCLVSIVLSYGNVKRKNIKIWGYNKKLLLARGIAGTISLVCLYYAVSTMPLAEATMIMFSQPIFSLILAVLLLKERIHLSTISCVVLSAIGLGFVVGPNIQADDLNRLPTVSIALAFIGAFFASIAYILVKFLSSKEDSSVIILYFPVVALPIATILGYQSFVVPDSYSLMLLVLVGIFTQMGQHGLTKAMAVTSANKVTTFSYLQVFLAIVFGYIFFDEIPPIYSIIGSILIVAGAIINSQFGMGKRMKNEE